MQGSNDFDHFQLRYFTADNEKKNKITILSCESGTRSVLSRLRDFKKSCWRETDADDRCLYSCAALVGGILLARCALLSTDYYISIVLCLLRFVATRATICY